MSRHRTSKLERARALLDEHGAVTVVGLAGVGKSWFASRLVAEEDALWIDCARDGASRLDESSDLVVVDGLEEWDEGDQRALARAMTRAPSARWITTSRVRPSGVPGALVGLGSLDPESAREMLAHALASRGVFSLSERAESLVLGWSCGFPPDIESASDLIELHGESGLEERLPREREHERVLAAVAAEMSAAERASWAVCAAFEAPFRADDFASRSGESATGLQALLHRGMLARLDGDPPRMALEGACARYAREHLELPAGGSSAHLEWMVSAPDVAWQELDAGLTLGLEQGSGAPVLVALASRLLASRRDALDTLRLTRCVERALEVDPVTPSALALVVDLAHRSWNAGDGARARELVELAWGHEPDDRIKISLHNLDAALSRGSQEPETALGSYDAALDLVADERSRSSVVVRVNRVGALWDRGEHDLALEQMLDVLTMCREQGYGDQEGVVLSNYGVMLHHQGRLEEAREHFERALELHESHENTRFVGIGWLDLTMLHHELGHLRRVLETGALALEWLERSEDARHAALVRAVLGCVRARLGEEPADELDLERERARFEASDDTLFAQALGLYARLTDVAAAALDGDVEVFDDASYATQGDEVRLPARVLAELTRALAQEDALIVDASHDAFMRSRAAGWVDLSRRAAYQSIFGMFVERRLEGAPPATMDEVFAAGWPDETIGAESSRNRVHVALSSLRRMGLRGVLQSVGGGYALSSDVPLVCVDRGGTIG